MSNRGPLSQLRASLQRSFDPGTYFSGPLWSEATGMAVALQKVRQTFSEREARPGQEDIVAAVRRFAASNAEPTFAQLKYVCYGVGSAALANGEALVATPGLLQRLFAFVEARVGRPKQFRRCFQGLLDSYFRADAQVVFDPQRRELWRPIRDFLARHVGSLRRALRAGVTPPPWVAALEDHRELLGDEPGSRIAAGFASGDLQDVKDVADRLQISRDSWVWQQALLSYIDHIARRPDGAYREGLKIALDVLAGTSDFSWSERLRREATARLVRRYAACASTPEHAGLRDLAVQVIGNPWLNRSAWDAHVESEKARGMVESWLKRRLIADFFELLSHDGKANPRRLAYWLNYEKRGLIEDMWFCLGADARANTAREFKDVRKRMEGRELALDDTTPENNAFLMKIGEYLVVEFGLTGNACFVYSYEDFKGLLLKRRLSTYAHLKRPKAAVKRLIHQSAWEDAFDSNIGSLLRDAPKRAPQPNYAGNAGGRATKDSSARTPRQDQLSEILEKCRAKGVEVEDHRRQNGALWVRVDRSSDLGLSRRLEKAGFSYKAGKGYWIKD